MQNMVWIWLSIVICLALIEILTVNLTTIWFVASGLISLVLSVFIDNYLIQFSVFVVGGVLLLIFTKKYLVNNFTVKDVKTNLDRVIGMEGIVTEDISKNNPGEVKVDGKRWTAISNKSICKGKIVHIKKIEGVKLIVEEEK